MACESVHKRFLVAGAPRLLSLRRIRSLGEEAASLSRAVRSVSSNGRSGSTRTMTWTERPTDLASFAALRSALTNASRG
eukprot:362646-Prorocentrum_minimum.AAC.4